jgi:shikimate kinase
MPHTFRTSVQVKATDLGLPHVILVGLPGSGKTTVGRAVAEATGRSFLDFDEEIVRREGMAIKDIFGAKGEQHFRGLERKLTMELAKTSGMIVAPGGGWVTQADIVGLVRPPALLVYLKVRPETAVKRLGAGVSSRPMLARGDPLAELKRLFGERQAAYELADSTVASELLTLQAVVDAVVGLTKEKAGG